MKTVLLVGATGNLGTLLAKELLAIPAKLRILTRAGSGSKLDSAISAQAEIAEGENSAFEGVDTVVSAVAGGPETIIDAQLRWFAKAREAGVKRFIPSDYSLNSFALSEGENVNSDWRRTFAHRAAALAGPMEIVHISNGCFLDYRVLFGFLGAIDLKKGEAYLWGDGNARMDFTTYADTAAYTGLAAVSDEPLPNIFEVAGDQLNFHELVKEVEAGCGISLAVKILGTLEDLNAVIAQSQRAEPENQQAWLPKMYWRAMLNGKGRLTQLQNGNYPSVQPKRVREYLQMPR